jgi:hypothetical protein
MGRRVLLGGGGGCEVKPQSCEVKVFKTSSTSSTLRLINCGYVRVRHSFVSFDDVLKVIQ